MIMKTDNIFWLSSLQKLGIPCTVFNYNLLIKTFNGWWIKIMPFIILYAVYARLLKKREIKLPGCIP